MRQRLASLICHRNRNFTNLINMGRRKRHNFKDKKNPGNYKNERNYETTPKENALFKKYYAGLGVMAEDEVDDFYNQMKEPLPVTFRITGYKSQAQELMKLIRTKFFDSLIGQSATSSENSSNPVGQPSANDGDTGPPAGGQNGEGAVATGDGAASVSSVGHVAGTAADGGADEGGGGGDGVSKMEEGEDGTTAEAKTAEASKGLTVDAIQPPKCLSWYPDGLAWQINLSRKAVRSQEVLSKLHKFLVSETETGNISRQEAVSMIPPLVLDIRSTSKVLDMCAAPGSKTAQLIEYLHKDAACVPEGFVVANDKENRRCYLMVHQVKRLSSPCCTIVNHDAAFFPKLRYSTDEDDPQHIMFDRVLADVPCSGDGTMRKNIDIWKKWSPTMGNSLHSLQGKILKRGLELLEVGGRVVYSTCSMQPVEDEAVIAEILRKCQGTVRLVDISSHLPGFKTVPGLSHWKLMSKQGQWLEDYESIPPSYKSVFTPSMFPPTPEEAKDFNLHLCHRILPHHQDTGGFFVAALEKVDHLPWSKEARLEKEKVEAEEKDASTESAAQNDNENKDGSETVNLRKRKGETEDGPQPKKRELKGYKEDPFLFLEPEDPVYPAIKEFYGLPETFPVNQLLYRSEAGVKRSLYFVNKAIRQMVICNENRVRFINMGVKFVSRNPSDLVPDCHFRLTQECIGSLRDQFTKRVVTVNKQDTITIFSEENPFLNKLSESAQQQLEQIGPGSLVFVYKPTESDPEPAFDLAYCGWRGKTSVRCFIPRFERTHGLLLFGKDLEEIRAEVDKKKKEREQAKKASQAMTASSSTTNPDDDDTADRDIDDKMDILEDEEGGLKEEEEEESKMEEESVKEGEEEKEEDDDNLKTAVTKD